MLWSCVSSRTWVCLLGWWSHRKSPCSRSHLRSHPIHPIANPTRVLVFKRRPIIIGIYLRRIHSPWSINLAENFWLSLSWICRCCCRRRRRKDDPLISSRVLYLNSECEFMVFCFQVVCNFLCSFQIRRSLQTTTTCWVTSLQKSCFQKFLALKYSSSSSSSSSCSFCSSEWTSVPGATSSTLRPTEKVWSWAPQTLAALLFARCRDATAATRDESKPPDRSTPNGTSVISRLTTACRDQSQRTQKRIRFASNSPRQPNCHQALQDTVPATLELRNFPRQPNCHQALQDTVPATLELRNWCGGNAQREGFGLRERGMQNYCLLEGSAEHSWIVRSVGDHGPRVPRRVEVSAKTSCSKQAFKDRQEWDSSSF